MIETVAEYFSAKLSEDVSRGMNKAAQHCQIVGRAPLGYRAGPNKRWQIDPVGAELVRRIFEWYASGKAMGQLAAQLNEEGHRTTNGTLYTRSSFNSILRNEKYIGVYSYGGEKAAARVLLKMNYFLPCSGGFPRTGTGPAHTRPKCRTC